MCRVRKKADDLCRALFVAAALPMRWQLPADSHTGPTLPDFRENYYRHDFRQIESSNCRKVRSSR